MRPACDVLCTAPYTLRPASVTLRALSYVFRLTQGTSKLYVIRIDSISSLYTYSSGKYRLEVLGGVNASLTVLVVSSAEFTLSPCTDGVSLHSPSTIDDCLSELVPSVYKGNAIKRRLIQATLNLLPYQISGGQKVF